MFDNEDVIETLGHFTVTEEHGRNYLYHERTRIAQCVNGDYDSRFGGISGWIRHIERRSVNRLSKIDDQLSQLYNEQLEIKHILESITAVK